MSEQASIEVSQGPFSIKYQGDSAFIKSDLKQLVQELLDMFANTGAPISTPPTGESSGVSSSGAVFKGTTNSVASKLGVKSGPDLIIAAAAKMRFVSGKESFSRRELLEAMREANSYFKKSYTGNMTAYLDTLQKAGRLNEIARDTYALPTSEASSLESRLVGA